MSLELRTKIVEGASGRLFDASVRVAMVSDKVLWTHWHGEMPQGVGDAQWEWDRFIDLGIALPDRFEVFVLESEGEIQGLRMLEISEDDVDQYGVHALRLSTAPWNRRPERRYRGVGRILVAIAILRSIELGHRGCVHCESLPEAEEFHERNGMTQFGTLTEEGLWRLRFTEEAAIRFLDDLRNDGLIP